MSGSRTGVTMIRGASLTTILILALCEAAASQEPARHYEVACERGDLAACNVLGLLYESGGVPSDVGRAAALYARACSGGLAVGCTGLGLLHEAGVGIDQDAARADSLVRHACEAGDGFACDLKAARNAGSPGTMAQAVFFKSGRVVDGETGAWLPQSIVELEELGIRAVSDSAGRVELGRLPSGTYRITGEHLGHETVSGSFLVPGNAEFLLLLDPVDVEVSEAPGRVIGRVVEQGESRGLSGVEIAIPEYGGVATLSNETGRFELSNLEPGLKELRLTRLGYATRTVALIVQPGSSVQLVATMSAEPIGLDAIEVTVRSIYLERAGFYDRAERISGAHFTRRDLDDIDPRNVSDLVPRIPQIDVLRDERGTHAVLVRGVTFRSRGACRLAIYVDGALVGGDLNVIPPDAIEAIEVYGGVGAPTQFRQNSCGAVVIWTRRE